MILDDCPLTLISNLSTKASLRIHLIYSLLPRSASMRPLANVTVIVTRTEHPVCALHPSSLLPRFQPGWSRWSPVPSHFLLLKACLGFALQVGWNLVSFPQALYSSPSPGGHPQSRCSSHTDLLPQTHQHSSCYRASVFTVLISLHFNHSSA